MVLRESPFPNRVLGGLYGLAQGLLYPSFWAANCLLDLKETTVEREQHRLQRCPPYALQATAKGLALVLLFVFSLPVALLGLVLWLPLQAARRPFAYQHTMPTEPWQGWELPGRDRAFSFVTANVCLLPDGLAKFSNLGQTRQRAAILAKRLTSPTSSYGAMHHNPQVPGAHGHRDKPEGRITASLPPELDFLCLQEVFDGQAAAVLRRQLGVRFEHILYDVGVYGFYRGCNFKVLNSGLFLASRYPVLDVQYHCYPNSTVEDALAAKGMLSVQVRGPAELGRAGWCPAVRCALPSCCMHAMLHTCLHSRGHTCAPPCTHAHTYPYPHMQEQAVVHGAESSREGGAGACQAAGGGGVVSAQPPCPGAPCAAAVSLALLLGSFPGRWGRVCTL